MVQTFRDNEVGRRPRADDSASERRIRMEPIVPMMFIGLFLFLAWFFHAIAKDIFQSDP